MTNKERQSKLDELKYCRSEKSGRDLSGSMEYCKFCANCVSEKCSATQTDREKNLFCAKAYNAMNKKKK